MTATDIATLLIKNDIRLDDQSVKDAQCTIKYKKHYKFYIKEQNKEILIPAKDLVEAYWDQINGNGAKALVL